MSRDMDLFFAAGGRLAQALGTYEPREGQRELADAVQGALRDGHHLLAEAGTGTGKTLAYLVPALASGRKVVVSTATKNLQEQIINHDLPLLEKALGRPVDMAVMKGRANYLCEVRADAQLTQLALPVVQARHGEALAHVRAWRDRTATGDTSELAELPEDAPLWRELTATSEQCTGRVCPAYERCWVTQMRRRAQAAPLVVVNHHLYLADAALRESLGNDNALVPQHDAVIFDEAHELEDIATQHFGYSVAERMLVELGHDIAQATVGTGLLLNRLRTTLTHMEPCARKLFDALPFQQGRLRLPDDFADDAIRAAHSDVDDLLLHLESELQEAQEEEIKAIARRVAQMAHALAFVLNVPRRGSLVVEQTDDAAQSFVRYSEANHRYRALVARPVDVASILGRALRRIPTVFVSATLRVNKSFTHFRRRVGVFEAEEVAVASPFDYARQASLYLPNDLPETDHPAFAEETASRAAALVRASGGGAFVLCTSHRSLPGMRDALERAGVAKVFTQGDAPKSHLIADFRERTDAALVATMGFWRGVDVPGAALRLVILDKLPFAVPTDPLIEARLEHLQAQGIDPFMGFQVPQAALLLQQGFGRLIRRQSDQGVVAIFDRRIMTRRYGPLLLRSLPACRRVSDFDEIIGVLQHHAARVLHPNRPGFVIRRKAQNGASEAMDEPPF